MKLERVKMMKFKIGDKVILTGELYYSSNDLKPRSYVKDKHTTITRISEGSRHPYNTTGDLGWCDEKSLTLDEPVVKKEIEINLIDKDGLIDYIKEHPDDVIIMNGKQVKDVFNL